MAAILAEKKTVDGVAKVLTKAKELLRKFEVGGVEFDPANLGRVAALVGNKIPVYRIEADDGQCKYASYGDPARNEILLDRKGMNKKPFLGTIVHEGVHAVNDLRKLKINSYVDEGLAYVAQMMFLAKINVSSGGNAVFDAAQAVYEAIESPKGKNRKALEKALFDAIAKCGAYSAETRNYNGIKGVK